MLDPHSVGSEQRWQQQSKYHSSLQWRKIKTSIWRWQQEEQQHRSHQPDLLPPLEVSVQRGEVLHGDLLPGRDPPPGPDVHVQVARVDGVAGVAHALVRHDGEDRVEALAQRRMLHGFTGRRKTAIPTILINNY